MSFNGWENGKLGDIAEIIMGQSPKGETCYKEEVGVPLLNGPTEFGRSYPKAVQWTTDARKECRTGDILFCVRGSTTGRMNWADTNYAIGRGIAAIRHKNRGIFNPYIKGILEYKLDAILASATGSTFPNVGKELLTSLPIKIPSEMEQKAIAATLSCLDDMSELNNRTNEVLEEMAQAIFKHWFVDFEFPNENGEPYKSSGGEMVDSEVGEMPRGWKVGKLTDVIKISTKTVDPRKMGETILEHYSIPAFDASKYPVFEVASSIKSNKFIVEKSCFLISKLNPAKKRHWRPLCVSDNAVCSTEFMVYYSLNIHHLDFYYYLLNDNRFSNFLNIMSSGSTNSRQRVTPSLTFDYTFAYPPDIQIERFVDIASIISMQLKRNTLEVQTLKSLRDTLLPKLMSGEIRVPIEEVG